MGMKYKLINKTTQKEFICDKITFEGFDYYTHNPSSINISNMSVMDYAMATNNPNIGLPKVIDEVEKLAKDFFQKERENNQDDFFRHASDESKNSLFSAYDKTFTPLYRTGYLKSQETHPFTEQDMLDFALFYFREKFNSTTIDPKSIQEVFLIWKDEQVKTIYYE